MNEWPWSAYDRWNTTPPEQVQEEEEYDKYKDEDYGKASQGVAM